MKKLLTSAALLLALASSGEAFAQASVNQSPSRNDTATFIASTPAPATACATKNTTVANATVTISPPGGYYVYITGVYIDLASSTTGATTTAVATWANMTNPGGTAPVYSLALDALTANLSGGQFRQIMETYPTALRSAAPGVPVTLTPSAQLAEAIICPRVTGYFAK
jgi:hypothetical protein